MLKIGAAVNYALAIAESVLGLRWIDQARRHDWDPKRVFYGIVWFLSAFMQVSMACDLLLASLEKKEEAGDDDTGDFED